MRHLLLLAMGLSGRTMWVESSQRHTWMQARPATHCALCQGDTELLIGNHSLLDFFGNNILCSWARLAG